MKNHNLAELQREMRKRWASPVHRKRYGEVSAAHKERFMEEFPESELADRYRQELEAEAEKTPTAA